MKAGDEIRYGTVRLKVLWPESTASGKEVNEDAMVLEMISKDFKGRFYRRYRNGDRSKN